MIMRIATIALALALAVFAGTAKAQQPRTLGLDQAVQAALENNPGLKSLDHQVMAAEGRASAASRTRWGRLDAFFYTQRTNDAWLVRPMSEELFEEAGGFADLPWDRNQNHWGASFVIPIYTGGSLNSGIEIGRLQSEGITALAEGTRWQLRFNATSLYTAAQALDQVLIAQDQQIAALIRTRENLDLMVSVGKRPELDGLKVVASLEAVRSGRAGTAAERVKVGALLLALMGENPEMPITVDPLPEHALQLLVPPEELHQSLGESSSLRRAQFVLEQADRMVTAERSSFIPKVTASGNYSWHDAPSLDGSLNTWEVKLGIIVPIFAGGSRSENLGSAKENAAAAGQDHERVRHETTAGLVESVAAFGAAQQQIVADRARGAAATEAARIEEIRYDSGAGTIEDFLLARAEEQDARAALARALAGARTAGERINSIVEKEVVK